ncbi:unnamed protein product [Boreogadus saida]
MRPDDPDSPTTCRLTRTQGDRQEEMWTRKTRRRKREGCGSHREQFRGEEAAGHKCDWSGQRSGKFRRQEAGGARVTTRGTIRHHRMVWPDELLR